ncbi:MAG: sodium:solute symporter family protein [Zetaproteobacteria bacterium]|nr:sodium:solute symporter family protein [Zetaproteobacteria bacterium]
MNLADSLALPDYLFIALYFSLLLWIAQKSSRPRESTLSYFLMSRRLTLPMFVATLVSTWYGGIFGVTEIAFENGMYAFFTQGVFWYLTYVLFALCVVPKLYRYRSVLTLPDLVEQSVGPKAARLTAVFNVIDVFPVAYVLAIGTLVQTFFSVSLFVGMLWGGLFVAAYTALGGLRSVVATDCLQFVVMFMGVGAVLVFSLVEVAPLATMWEALPPAHKSAVGVDSAFSYAVWGFIALATLIDPNFYTRCFAAVDLSTARLGILVSTGFWIIFDLCTTLGALYARFYLPEAVPRQAYLQYAMEILPSGFKGMMVASIASTIMSTLDSYLFTASTIGIKNLSNLAQDKMVFAHRIFVFVFVLAAVCMATQFTGGFKQVWKFFGSLNGGCLLFPVMLSLFRQGQVTESIFCLAVVLSAAVAILWEFFFKGIGGIDIETFYVAILVNGIVYIGCRRGPPATPQPSHLYMKREV